MQVEFDIVPEMLKNLISQSTVLVSHDHTNIIIDSHLVGPPFPLYSFNSTRPHSYLGCIWLFLSLIPSLLNVPGRVLRYLIEKSLIMGVASTEAREAVASSLFWIMTRVSGVSHTPHTMCVRSDDRDRS